MNNYPLGNFLVQIKNAHLASKKEVVTPWSKVKGAVAKLLVENGFLARVEVKKEKNKSYPFLKVKLINRKKLPFWELKLYSKPGRRYYASVEDIPYSTTDKGMIIISTSKGLMKGSQARKSNLGGEIVAAIW